MQLESGERGEDDGYQSNVGTMGLGLGALTPTDFVRLLKMYKD